jgi:hypothetical protein
MESKTCKHCSASFTITDQDKEFYSKHSPTFNGVKYDIPNPTLCPDCRQQRRLTFRNERKLYHRPCGKTGKTIISNFAPEKTYTVYETKERFSDARDATDYGRDYDPTQTLFAQFDALLHTTPQISLLGVGNENCEYNNHGGYSKNCYLCFDYGRGEDSAYLSRSYTCKHAFDISYSAECELSSNLLDCMGCTKCDFCRQADHCYDCQRCYDCVGCNSCFLSSNLANKQFYILNVPYTKEDYEIKVAELKAQWIASLQSQFTDLVVNKSIHKYANIMFCENVTGDNLSRCKNCHEVYGAKDSEDCGYVYDPMIVQNIQDDNFSGNNCNHCLETIGCEDSSNLRFCYACRSACTNIFYSYFCFACSDCFACTGIRNKQYCILNKQYTKEEYEKLVPQIIEKMEAEWEWGEFFPSRISPFAYNESLGQESFPLTKEEALGQWFTRKDEDYAINVPASLQKIEAKDLPNIQQAEENILQTAIICEVTGRPFRIIKSELEYYKSHTIPLPTKHPDQRHLERMHQRNPRKLWQRPCMKCWIPIKSSYAPERKEIVYCEQCYNKEIYG